MCLTSAVPVSSYPYAWTFVSLTTGFETGRPRLLQALWAVARIANLWSAAALGLASQNSTPGGLSTLRQEPKVFQGSSRPPPFRAEEGVSGG